jgi:hypothetical protein
MHLRDSRALRINRRAQLIGMVGAACALGGCIRVVHVQPEPPSPLRGISDIAISFDYSHLLVGGLDRDAFLAKKTAEDPAYPKTWADLLAAFEDNFILELRSGWGQVTVVPQGQQAPATSADLNVVVSELEIGHFIPFATRRTEVKVAMRWSVNGQLAHVQDEQDSFKPSLRVPSVFQHIKPIGQQLGRAAARFMRSKQR